MKNESSIETSSLITFWLVEQSKPNKQFTSLILVLQSVTGVLMVSIFHLEMVKTLQVRQDMQALIHILDMNSQEEMILNALAMFFYIFSKEFFLGKDFQEDLKLKNMPI